MPNFPREPITKVNFGTILDLKSKSQRGKSGKVLKSFSEIKGHKLNADFTDNLQKELLMN